MSKIKDFFSEEKSNTAKLKLLLTIFILIHSAILIFSYFYNLRQLLIFNIGSIFTYMVSFFFIHKNPRLIFYISFYEIMLHSFLCLILIGNNFGFSIYFVALCPMAYYFLYSLHARRYIVKASLMTFISFVLYITGYVISTVLEPLYTSPKLAYIEPAIYIFNMFVMFATIGIFSIFFIVENEIAYKKLRTKNLKLGSLANRDTLTGLYNRRTMSDHILKLYTEYKVIKKDFSLILCDIDDFKNCNDTYGHENGDKVLVAISNALTSQTRSNDFLCRWGGEEFLILLNKMDLEASRNVAERIRKNISELDIVLNDSTKINVTMTFGVACVSEVEKCDSLFTLADERLYKGKNSGKNIVV